MRGSNLGDAAAQGLGSLTAAKVDQVEATSATKEGGGGRAGRVQAAKMNNIFECCIKPGFGLCKTN